MTDRIATQFACCAMLICGVVAAYVAVLVWAATGDPRSAYETGDAQLGAGFTSESLPAPVILEPGDCALVLANFRFEKIPCPEYLLNPHVTWLGWVVTGAEHEAPLLPFPGRPEVSASYKVLHHHPEYELGLRPDGVVVWRQRQP